MKRIEHLRTHAISVLRVLDPCSLVSQQLVKQIQLVRVAGLFGTPEPRRLGDEVVPSLHDALEKTGTLECSS